MSLTDAKAGLRDQAKAARARAHKALRAVAGEMLRESVLDSGLIPTGALVAGYLPLAEEIDPGPLMTALFKRGRRLALPVVTATDAPLIFRDWKPNDPLEPGKFGTRHPLSSADEVLPDVILMPLVGFDLRGHRLGWGGGYYDRTLERLDRRQVTTIGLAYSAQRLDAIPDGGHDQPMNWIATETEIIRGAR